MSLISAAVAPVVLISAVAILFSGLTAKHSHLADQIRQLTTEFRHEGTCSDRRRAIKHQLRLFERRINCLWVANSCLSLAILSFVVTVLFVVASQRTAQLGLFGIAAMLTGLIFLIVALSFETFEIALGRASLVLETHDIDKVADDDC